MVTIPILRDGIVIVCARVFTIQVVLKPRAATYAMVLLVRIIGGIHIREGELISTVPSRTPLTFPLVPMGSTEPTEELT